MQLRDGICTQNRRHDANARVGVGLVGLSDTQLGKRRQARSGCPGDDLSIFDDHDDAAVAG